MQVENSCILDEYYWKVVNNRWILDKRSNIEPVKEDTPFVYRPKASNLSTGDPYDRANNSNYKLCEGDWVFSEVGLVKILTLNSDSEPLVKVQQTITKKKEKAPVEEKKPEEVAATEEKKPEEGAATEEKKPVEGEATVEVTAGSEELTASAGVTVDVEATVGIKADVEVTVNAEIGEVKKEEEAKKEEEVKKEEEAKKEEDEMVTEEIELTFPPDSLKKNISIGVRVFTLTEQYLLNNFTININNSFSQLRKELKDILEIPGNFELYLNQDQTPIPSDSGEVLHNKNIKEGDEIVLFLKPADKFHLMKRSTSNDRSYGISDKKHLSVFYVDCPIVINEIGFYRDYYDKPTKYDIELFKINSEGQKELVYSQANITAETSEVDSSTYYKMVKIEEVTIEPYVRYFFYCNYTLDGMYTYYGYNYNYDIEISEAGVKFYFQDESESGCRSSYSSGCFPCFSFKPQV